MNSDPLHFAAFIITYNRPDILKESISSLLHQTYSPNQILIVDNSLNDHTQQMVDRLNSDKLIYHKVGYNSGPAGGSKIGLLILSELGYKWIYWGDDNNPPRDSSVFKRMFECIDALAINGNKEHVGLISGKGAFFNHFNGRIRSLTNAELKKAEITEVDVVPGGHTLIVNSEVIKKEIIPDESLFFGFEDLDFSLKLRKHGYKIYVDAKTWLQIRYKHNDLKNAYRPRIKSFGDKTGNLNRQYYSTRNLLKIFYSQKLWFPFIFQLIKTLIKIPSGFLYGLNFGVKNCLIQSKALRDFFVGNYQKNLKVD
ncbi:glycosyltransferase [Christiangramia salexigens]|uniref:Glycosyltransferase 2-like domain-containing protein n=1 Tax=Christiangramia salexigens TaxID=1913577 RepID=A0A1L3J2D4_9FLAO|nr:glycosyltransferase [Christiangramia salexigens]APG59284.1 hypothetical protein LPB144_02150 [Christiangramia salexigens]